METEIWKDIPNYEGLYLASNLGRIKSLKFGKEKILKTDTNKNLYGIVALSKDKISKHFYVHHIIAITFLNHKPCGYKLVINHINFDKLDNRVENLEIITQRKNTDKKHIKSSSKYTGVYFNNSSKKWRTTIYFKNKRISLGSFDNEKDAGNAYLKAIHCIENWLQIVTKEKSSKYKGVTFNINTKRWHSQITISGKSKYLGSYCSELEASIAYNNALKQ